MLVTSFIQYGFCRTISCSFTLEFDTDTSVALAAGCFASTIGWFIHNSIYRLFRLTMSENNWQISCSSSSTKRWKLVRPCGAIYNSWSRADQTCQYIIFCYRTVYHNHNLLCIASCGCHSSILLFGRSQNRMLFNAESHFLLMAQISAAVKTNEWTWKRNMYFERTRTSSLWTTIKNVVELDGPVWIVGLFNERDE